MLQLTDLGVDDIEVERGPADLVLYALRTGQILLSDEIGGGTRMPDNNPWTGMQLLIASVRFSTWSFS